MISIKKSVKELLSLCVVGACKEVFDNKGSISSFYKLNRINGLSQGIIKPYVVYLSNYDFERLGHFAPSNLGFTCTKEKKIYIREDIGAMQIYTYLHESRHNFQHYMQENLFSKIKQATLTPYEKVIVAYLYIFNKIKPYIIKNGDDFENDFDLIGYRIIPEEIDARIYSIDMMFKCFEKAETTAQKNVFFNILSKAMSDEMYINDSVLNLDNKTQFMSKLQKESGDDIMFSMIKKGIKDYYGIAKEYGLPYDESISLARNIINKNYDSARIEFAQKVNAIKTKIDAYYNDVYLAKY